MGFLNDFINGKEKTAKADPLAGDINTAGKSGLSLLMGGVDALNKNFYSNPDGYVSNQIDKENNLLRSASNDATRKTRELINQRGMGASSIGLGQEANVNRDLNQKLALNNASGLDRLKGLYNEQMQTGTNLFNIKASQGPVQMQDQTYRTGGYGQLISPAISGGLSLLGNKLSSPGVESFMSKTPSLNDALKAPKSYGFEALKAPKPYGYETMMA